MQIFLPKIQIIYSLKNQFQKYSEVNTKEKGYSISTAFCVQIWSLVLQISAHYSKHVKNLSHSPNLPLGPSILQYT